MQKLYIPVLLSLSLLLSVVPVLAQNDTLLLPPTEAEKDTSWKKETEIGANLNQGSFSSNWTGGGVNSVALGLFLNSVLEYEKGRNSWRNDFQNQYGIVKSEGQEGSRKNLDRLFFDSKYGRQLTDKWSFIANINLLTQFAPGYIYRENPDGELVRRKVSGFFAPAYITEAVGMQYKPVPYFYVTFSPGAVRQTVVADKQLYLNTPNQKNYGVPIGRTVRTEFALMQIVANFKKDIATNVNLNLRYLLFANVRSLGAIDNRLDAMLTAKINKYLNVNLGAILVYDEDQSNKIQYAQALAIGFVYVP